MMGMKECCFIAPGLNLKRLLKKRGSGRRPLPAEALWRTVNVRWKGYTWTTKGNFLASERGTGWQVPHSTGCYERELLRKGVTRGWHV
jgi:hypothetical protein